MDPYHTWVCFSLLGFPFDRKPLWRNVGLPRAWMGWFWGWDPVENASLMPWFTATAYLHSVMIQERRDMLKVWNMALVMLTYFLTVFGTFLTRSGLIDSVHTFAQSDVGDYFIFFLITLAIVSIGLILWRVVDGSLKSKSQVDYLMSREGVFLLNNIVLLACVGVVMFGTSQT